MSRGTSPSGERVPLRTVATQWARIGCVGFGGPPAHINLLRRLCVTERGWLSPADFDDAVAATNLLPGPASTQLAIFAAWRVAGPLGAVLGGACFIVPGLLLIVVLAGLFLSGSAPLAVHGAAAGAGAAVAAVAVRAAIGLVPDSWRRADGRRSAIIRWSAYLLAGGAAAALVGPWLVLVLLGCGVVEVVARRGGDARALVAAMPALFRHHPIRVAASATGPAGLSALCWTALKVGALSYGGGFVIIPLMQSDAVHRYHWMTDPQFLNAVALGQITPGPVVNTVAVVGYAAAGALGGLLAAFVAFAPSFVFVLAGAPRFDRLRANAAVRAFLSGAGPAVIGAIAGSAVPLAAALSHLWQIGVLAAAAVWLLLLRRGVVAVLVGAGALGVLASLAGAPITA